MWKRIITTTRGDSSSFIKNNQTSDFEEQQADGNAVYDQEGNVLYYNVFYSQQFCNAKSNHFVKGTLEAKVSWRIVLEDSTHTYYTIDAKIPNTDKEVKLGMLGIHFDWTPAPRNDLGHMGT